MFTLSQNKLAIDGDNLAEDDAVAVSAAPEIWTAETHEIKFLVLILGARTPPPKMDAPVTKIPLAGTVISSIVSSTLAAEQPTMRRQIRSDRYTAPRRQAPTHTATTLRESCRH